MTQLWPATCHERDFVVSSKYLTFELFMCPNYFEWPHLGSIDPFGFSPNLGCESAR